MIYYMTPFSSEKRLGHIHNEYCKIVPNDDDDICLLDPDTMFLHPHQQAWIEDILKAHGNDWDLLGCMTNRVGLKAQVISEFEFNVTNIKHHMNIAADAYNYELGNEPDEIEQTDLIAGFCMIFKKSLWNKIKFEESIQFDMKFCNAVKKAGGKIGVMKGIYIFHQYRLGQEDPKNYIKHLR